MKKSKMAWIISLMLVLVLALSLVAGCGGGAKQEQPKASAPSEPAKEQPKAKYPEKPITLIIPYDAGGAGNDGNPRIAAEGASKILGQPIVAVNKPGAAGATGFTEIKNSKPDGYTIGLVVNSVATHILTGNLDFDHHAFEPIITLNKETTTIAVGKDKPWKTMQEFIDYIKKNPGKAKIASSAPGGGYHTALMLMKKRLGLNFEVVVEGGGGVKISQMAAGGHVDACMATPADVAPLVKGGNLRMLAVLSPERNQTFPDVPTMKELGYDVVFEGIVRGLVAPKGTPKEVIDILYKAFKQAVEDPKVKEFCVQNALTPYNVGGKEFMDYFDYIQNEVYKPILAEVGLLKEKK